MPGPVKPVHARPWVGAAEHGDFVAQQEKFDVVCGEGAAHQEDQYEYRVARGPMLRQHAS